MADTSILKNLSDATKRLVADASRSVVCIENDDGLWRTGLIVEGYGILTVARQAEDGETVRIRLPGGTESSASVAGYDPSTEIALLRAAGETGGKSLAVRTGLPEVGELSLAVAYPSPEGVEARLGLIRCVSEGTEETGRYFQTDGRTFPGFAGAPVIDTDGMLLGITALTAEPGFGYCIPGTDALEIVKRLAEGGSPKRGYLGVRTMPAELSESGAGGSGEAQASGLVIIGVERDSPAFRAGLMVGDVLISLAGKPVTDHRDLITIISGNAGTGAIETGILRGGERRTLPVTLEPRRESTSRRSWGRHGWRFRGR